MSTGKYRQHKSDMQVVPALIASAAVARQRGWYGIGWTGQETS
jgi:hypothetical protein